LLKISSSSGEKALMTQQGFGPWRMMIMFEEEEDEEGNEVKGEGELTPYDGGEGF
jgi:hypothetical protein